MVSAVNRCMCERPERLGLLLWQPPQQTKPNQTSVCTRFQAASVGDRHLSRRQGSRMNSASVSVIGDQQTFVSVLSRKKRHLARALSNSSVLEKRLLLATAALLALALALLIALVVAASYRKSRDKNRVCESKECIRSAAMFLQSMDPAVDPCEDFYKFTCGNWAEPRLLPEDTSSSWFSERTKHLQQRVVEILQMNSSSTDPKPVRQARTFFRSCTDTETLDELGLKPLREVLDQIGLPHALPSAATAGNFSLAHTLAATQRVLNSDVLVQLSTFINPATNTSVLLISPSFSFSSLPEVVAPAEVPHSRLTGNQLFKLRLSYISDVLGELTEIDQTNATQLVAIALKILFTDAHIKTDIKKSETEDEPLITTFKELQETMDNARNTTSKNSLKFEWSKYLSTLMKGLNASLDMDSTVAVMSPAFFEAIALRISNSRPETIQRFVWWKVVESVAPHTTTTLRKIRDDFVEALFGPSSRITRVKRCSKITKSYFNYAISYVMATDNSLEESTKKIQAMLGDITAAFSQSVSSLDWMDTRTKAATVDKAAAIRRYVGYPEWLLQRDELDKLYANLTILKGKYLWNMLGIKAKEVVEVLSTLGSPPINQTDFRYDGTVILLK